MDLPRKLAYITEHILNISSEKKQLNDEKNSQLKELRLFQAALSEAIRFNDISILEFELSPEELERLKKIGNSLPSDGRIHRQYLKAQEFSQTVSNGNFVMARTGKKYLCSFAQLNPASLDSSHLFGSAEDFTGRGDTIEAAIYDAIQRVQNHDPSREITFEIS